MSHHLQNPAATLQQAWQIHQAGDVDRAATMYRNVIAVDAKNADAWVFLGIALFDQRRFDESADSYQRAIEIKPIYPIAWNNLGNSLRMQGQVDAADECFDKSLGQDPRYLSALKNRGTLWIWSGEIERGMQWYQQGLLMDPDNAELHRNLGVIELLRGNYTAGWDHYRWRWRMAGMHRPRTSAPRWNGESLAGKTFLLYGEQGLGDAIHFVRTAATLRDRGATVVLQCAKKLIPLFSSTTATLGVHQLIEDTTPPPRVDFHGSMIEVVDVLYQIDGKIDFRTDLIEPDKGYLHVSQPLVDYWKTWLDANTRGRRIGINWQGNPEHHADVYRSMTLETLRPLSEAPDVTLVNLQFGFGSEQLETCGFGDKIVRLPSHVDATEGAFTDTIAILANLDEVITTDTSIAHLAGAAGVDVTVMLGRVPDWRWLESGDTTPWYPTMRLARQQSLGHWDDVVAQVADR